MSERPFVKDCFNSVARPGGATPIVGLGGYTVVNL